LDLKVFKAYLAKNAKKKEKYCRYLVKKLLKRKAHANFLKFIPEKNSF
jgi:hypothetical protein